MISDFQIFGSPSSKDYDVMVFVTEIPSIEDSKQLCIEHDRLLYARFLDLGWKIKKVNSNLAILKDGVVERVFKGTTDEVNNSLYLTYNDHQQLFPQHITRLVDRDVDMKIMRTARVILSFLARTQYRVEVKLALHGNFIHRVRTLESIDLTQVKDLGTKNVEWSDYLKIVSFQLGQTLALMEDAELYTKEHISEYYNVLEPMLFRSGEDLVTLQLFLNTFIKYCKERIPHMRTYDEYKN